MGTGAWHRAAFQLLQQLAHLLMRQNLSRPDRAMTGNRCQSLFTPIGGRRATGLLDMLDQFQQALDGLHFQAIPPEPP